MIFVDRAVVAILLASASPGAYAQASNPRLDKPPASTVPPLPTIQVAPADSSVEQTDGDIVVSGVTPFGSVQSDISPEVVFNSADIRSFGVSTISELINDTSFLTDAVTGPPILLLNGRRISSPLEIYDLPTEAIQRTEIFPEEVALAYGYPATQRVVNIVLRQYFRATTAELAAGASTDGGRENGKATAGLFRLREDTRFSLDFAYARSAMLLESQRDITFPVSAPYSLAGNITAPRASDSREIDPALSAIAGEIVTIASVPSSRVSSAPTLESFLPGANTPTTNSIGNYRSLAPATEVASISATLARPLGSIAASVSGRLEHSKSDGVQGLPSWVLKVPANSPYSPFVQPVELYRYVDTVGPLKDASDLSTARLGLGLNGELNDTWTWSFTGGYDFFQSDTRNDRAIPSSAAQDALNAQDPYFNPFGAIPTSLLAGRRVDNGRQTTHTILADLLANGSLFTLPAGEATTSIRLSGSSFSSQSRSVRNSTPVSLALQRESVSVRGSVDLPIASRFTGSSGPLGDLSLNTNAEIEQVATFGILRMYGYGLRWSPIRELSFNASMTQQQSAPSPLFLNGPSVSTPNVITFDYASGQTEIVSRVSGGNPFLRASDRSVLRLNLSIRPIRTQQLSFTGSLTRTTTEDQVVSFPDPTAEIEAAFPERFTRDQTGRLVTIDARPLNAVWARTTQLRLGINFSKPLRSGAQKRLAAWRAAGEKEEDMPAEVRASREAVRAQLAARAAERQLAQEAARVAREAERVARRAEREALAREMPEQTDQSPPPIAIPPFRPVIAPPDVPIRPFNREAALVGNGRLRFNLSYTALLEDSLRIADGLSPIDRLDSGLLSGLSGPSRHRIDTSMAYNHSGLGLNVSSIWRSATEKASASTLPTSGRRFSDVTTVNIQVLAEFGQMAAATRMPVLRGARLSFELTNVFNSRRDQTIGGDAFADYRLGYQPEFDRAFRVQLRKVFHSVRV
jgi:hypothetical protein